MKEVPTPLTDAADDHTMRFSGRFERVRDVSRQLERDRHELIEELRMAAETFEDFVQANRMLSRETMASAAEVPAKHIRALLERMKP